jgi:hypothetical protein
MFEKTPPDKKISMVSVVRLAALAALVCVLVPSGVAASAVPAWLAALKGRIKVNLFERVPERRVCVCVCVCVCACVDVRLYLCTHALPKNDYSNGRPTRDHEATRALCVPTTHVLTTASTSYSSLWPVWGLGQ